MASDNLLELKDVETHFFTDEGVVKSVDGVSYNVPRGKTLCVVGESGSGKSVTARSILRIVDHPGRIVGGEILLHRAAGESLDIAKLDPYGDEIRAVRGKDIAMIFQEPMSALSPVHTIGDQLTEAMLLHLPVTKRQAEARAVEMLTKVGLPKPGDRLKSYPFELSGGMRQRVCIAMALMCEPKLLIADEPTTALDVTTQANILDVLSDLQREMDMSVMFITHDLGVVAEIADEVVVMYLGKAVERGTVDEIFYDPKHPYTKSLLNSIPKLELGTRHRLEAIRGMVPHPFNRPTGCSFHTRCDEVMVGVCNKIVPPPEQPSPGREVRCLLYSDVEALRKNAPKEEVRA